MGDWVANRVMAAPAVAPMRTRKVLRIIREPFRCRVSPTTGLDRRETRLYGTRYIVSAGREESHPSTQQKALTGHPPKPLTRAPLTRNCPSPPQNPPNTPRPAPI